MADKTKTTQAEVPAEEKVLTFQERVVALQNELNAPKDKFNSFGKYAYRSAEGIMEALKPILKKYGCYLTFNEEIFQMGEAVCMKCTAELKGPNGESLTTSTPIMVEKSKKGMTAEQVVGSALSYVRKYCLQGMFLIDDNKDPDTDEYAKQTSKPEPKPIDTYLATISKFKNIADMEIWWNNNLEELKAHPKYRDIFAYASQKGKELNANQ